MTFSTTRSKLMTFVDPQVSHHSEICNTTFVRLKNITYRNCPSPISVSLCLVAVLYNSCQLSSCFPREPTLRAGYKLFDSSSVFLPRTPHLFPPSPFLFFRQVLLSPIPLPTATVNSLAISTHIGGWPALGSLGPYLHRWPVRY